MSERLSPLMHEEHQRCDALLAEGEEKLFGPNPNEGKQIVQEFIDETTRHFEVEEDLLFPALEMATGMTSGPTQVMRMEHDQMRGLLANMKQALSVNADQVASVAETLMILMQQHNLKEENILYPMMDQHLTEQLPELIAKAKELLRGN